MLFARLNGDPHGTFLRGFDRVADQVADDLSHANRVRPRLSTLAGQRQLELLLLCRDTVFFEHIVGNRINVSKLASQCELAGLETRQIQMSLINALRCSPERRTVSRFSWASGLSGPSTSLNNTSAKPKITLSGVLSS